jgi:hypothetical protein
LSSTAAAEPGIQPLGAIAAQERALFALAPVAVDALQYVLVPVGAFQCVSRPADAIQCVLEPVGAFQYVP